uniref:Uncharacterized protein n=1 Tax=Rhizophora mucronata TaxID=61149 RepID=A0A2P2Q3E7_RHIMU
MSAKQNIKAGNILHETDNLECSIRSNLHFIHQSKRPKLQRLIHKSSHCNENYKCTNDQGINKSIIIMLLG